MLKKVWQHPLQHTCNVFMMLTCNNVSFLMTLMVVVIVTIFYNVTTMLQINLLCGDFVTSCCKLRWGRNAFNHGWSASFCKHSPWSSFSERGVSWNFVLKVTQGGLQTSKEGLTGSQNINQMLMLTSTQVHQTFWLENRKTCAYWTLLLYSVTWLSLNDFTSLSVVVFSSN